MAGAAASLCRRRRRDPRLLEQFRARRICSGWLQRGRRRLEVPAGPILGLATLSNRQASPMTEHEITERERQFVNGLADYGDMSSASWLEFDMIRDHSESGR